MNTIAVFGASGFVGTAFVEHALRKNRYHVRPFINSGKNAWRLARLGLDIERANIFDEDSLVRTLEGCTHVVNCIMGPQKVMLEGFKNLLSASKKAGVHRFIHLSSITAYGEPPPPDSVHEEARPNSPQRGSYGWIKMTQDKMVLEASNQDLPCEVLCPPIVSGPRSTQLMWLLKCINEHRFALVDGGNCPCAVVDVDNLAHAMMLALDSPEPDGKRIFVLDEIVPSWRELLEGMTPLFDANVSYPELSRTIAERLIRQKTNTRLSPLATVKHLISPEARKVLGQDPLIRALGQAVKQVIPASTLSAMRKKGAAQNMKQPTTRKPSLDALQLARQLRGVHHSYDRAKSKLGYTPHYSFAESMERFRNWYMDEQGWTSEHADLVRVLDQ